jgi:hypothetical protein
MDGITVTIQDQELSLSIDDGTVVSIDDSEIQILTVGEQGPPGAQGASGDLNFLFVQSIPSATWTINHGLGKYPSVTVIDSAGQFVEGNIQYTSLNQVILTFSGAFSGEASCN